MFFVGKTQKKKIGVLFSVKPPEIGLISVLNKQCSNNKIIKLYPQTINYLEKLQIHFEWSV